MSNDSSKPAAHAGQIYPPEGETLEHFFREVPPEGGIDAGSFSDALRDLSSEVARIALASIEGYLPAWAAFRTDGGSCWAETSRRRPICRSCWYRATSSRSTGPTAALGSRGRRPTMWLTSPASTASWSVR